MISVARHSFLRHLILTKGGHTNITVKLYVNQNKQSHTQIQVKIPKKKKILSPMLCVCVCTRMCPIYPLITSTKGCSPYSHHPLSPSEWR